MSTNTELHEIAMALNRLTLAIGHAAILGKTSEQMQKDEENQFSFLEERVASSLRDAMEDAENAIVRLHKIGLAKSNEINWTKENEESK